MIILPGQAGADIFNCPDDYIVIGGTRLCGNKFNDGSVNDDFTMNADVTGKRISKKYIHSFFSEVHFGEVSSMMLFFYLLNLMIVTISLDSVWRLVVLEHVKA